MEFWFCDKCGKRVISGDFTSGAVREEGRIHCAACAPVHILAPTPVPAARSNATQLAVRGTTSVKIIKPVERAESRRESTTMRSAVRGDTARVTYDRPVSPRTTTVVRRGSSTTVMATFAAGAMLFVAGLIFVFSGATKPPELASVSTRSTAPAAATALAAPSSLSVQSGAVTRPPASAASAPSAPSEATGASGRAAQVESDSNETKAGDAYSVLEKKLSGMNDSDKKVAALDDFIKQYGDTIVVSRARTARTAILNPEPAAPPQAKRVSGKQMSSEEKQAAVKLATEKLQKGDIEGCIADYTALIKNDEREPIYFQNRADARRVTGDYEGSFADADKSIALNHANQGAWMLRAIAAYALKKDDEARSSLEQAATVSGIDTQTLNQQLGQEFQRARILQNGKEMENKNPLSAEEFLARGQYRAVAKHAGALEDYTEALRLDPSLGAKGLYAGIAELQRADKKFAAALQTLKQWSELKPESAAGLNAYAWELLTTPDEKLVDAKAALPIAEKAVELTQHADSAILDTLALAYFKNHQRADALATQQKAFDVLPQNTPAAVRNEYEKRLSQYKAAADADIH